MKQPTRHTVLRVLDAVMATAAGHLEGLLPQFSDFRAQNVEWLFDNRIIGYGFPGRGGFAGNIKDSPRVSFYVESDENADALSSGIIPHRIVLPKTGVGVETEVVNIGFVSPTAPTTKTRPIRTGISISHVAMSSGTLGAFARSRDTNDRNTYLLSSNHVLTDYNTGKIGDSIIQPGKSDKGKNTNKVAELARFVALTYDDNAFLNTADAAIGLITDPDCMDTDAIGISLMKVQTDVHHNARVHAVGRTSGKTDGRVVDPSARIRLRYPRSARSTSYVGFVDVVLCTPFTRPGDSGALVLNESGKAMGLIMAGSDRASLFCKIGYVCDQLNIDLISVPS